MISTLRILHMPLSLSPCLLYPFVNLVTCFHGLDWGVKLAANPWYARDWEHQLLPPMCRSWTIDTIHRWTEVVFTMSSKSWGTEEKMFWRPLESSRLSRAQMVTCLQSNPGVVLLFLLYTRSVCWLLLKQMNTQIANLDGRCCTRCSGVLEKIIYNNLGTKIRGRT